MQRSSSTDQPSEWTNAWSQEPRVLRNHTLDSTRWRGFPFRHDDIVIATWAKAGTTWVQQIVAQLIFQGAPRLPLLNMSPWVEHRGFPREALLAILETQRHRRFVKSHLPADALVYNPAARYIYVGRDGRDVIWSWHHHHRHMTNVAYHLLNDLPGRVGPPLERAPEDFRQAFHAWLDRDGHPLWPFWAHVRSWWELRDRPNVMLVHFNDLKADLPRWIRRIAAFLEAPIDEQVWPRIVEQCSFGYMKRTATTLSPMLDMVFVGGAQTFVNRGANGGWRNELNESDVRKYEEAAGANLPSACVKWLAAGLGNGA